MAYSSQDLKDGKSKGVPHYSVVAPLLQAIDLSLVGGGGGYTAPAWANDKQSGSLGPTVLDRLRQMCVALANPAAHYVTVPLVNDKLSGGLGPDLLAKINAMQAEVQNLRP